MTRIVPTVGRIVLCFRPDKWDKPLPGIVTSVQGDTPESRVNATVAMDTNFQFCQFIAVPVLDPIVAEQPPSPAAGEPELTPEAIAKFQKASVERQFKERKTQYDRWAEWMPYQTGQAAKTEDVGAKLADRAQILENALSAAARINVSLSAKLEDQQAALAGLTERIAAMESKLSVLTLPKDPPAPTPPGGNSKSKNVPAIAGD